MNKRQKLVQQQYLNNEEEVIRRLNQVYTQSQKDIEANIRRLTFKIGELQAEYDWLDPNDPERARIKSMIQSKIYQKQYQEQIKSQVDGILKQMQTRSYLTVSDYLDECYTDGFIGTIFDAHGQGIPIMTPINQESMVRAVQLESKISKGLYTRLGEDVNLLKKKIAAQVSRSISTGMTFAQTAKALEGYTRIGYNNAIRIARTEGHRIQTTATMDAMTAAKDKGADVFKQWDSTLDGITRESHRAVDGEIRELDKPFSNGLMYPGDPSGGAAEVVNCRCALLQRARWALDEDELQTLKDRAAFYGLDKTDQFDDFKQKYLTAITNSGKIEPPKISNDANKLIDALKQLKVDYNPANMHNIPLSEAEIISALAGGDRTKGSCASVGLAYIGQKKGMNVLDFRDGESRAFFSRTSNLLKIARLPGSGAIFESAKSTLTIGNKLLKHVKIGKEYYLCVGRHAAIVRKTKDGVLQYLELQSPIRNGWRDFDGNPRYTLTHRFGCSSRSYGYEFEEFMLDLDEFKATDDLRELLGYINTAENKQVKGDGGSVK